MAYHYLAYGIPVISEIELPALIPLADLSNIENPVQVTLGAIPAEIPGAVKADYFTCCTPNELIFTIPEKVKYHIKNGNQITIEVIDPHYSLILIYCYSYALTAIVYQRNFFPFHVSGVFTEAGKVALFAAESGTGKSTLAVKLQELGFQPFTDDTAILFIKDGKCYAQASYPMIRLWENSIPEQKLLNGDEKQKIFDNGEKEKFGFSFHHKFITEPVEVAHFIFLEKEGMEIQQNPVKKIEAFKKMSDNAFLRHWIPGQQKSKLQFELISKILNILSFQQVSRPLLSNSFEAFPLYIKNILLNVDI